MNYEALSQPFPDRFIDTVRKGSRSESYVNHAVVTDRLNRVHPGWTLELVSVERYEIEGVPHCAGVTVRLAVDGVSRDEVGTVGRPSNYGDEIKACMSDALKRAAMRFGVAIQLWHELPPRTAGKAPAAPGERPEQPSAVHNQPTPGTAMEGVRAAADAAEGGTERTGKDATCPPHRNAVTTLPNGRVCAPGKAYCPDCRKVVAA